MGKIVQPLAEVFGHLITDQSDKANRYRSHRLCPLTIRCQIARRLPNDSMTTPSKRISTLGTASFRKARGTNVLHRGSWCAYCSGKAKHTIEQLRSLASERGGRCLSSEYKDRKQKLLWECSKKHTWMAKTYQVYYGGTWCPICYKEQKNKTNDE